MSNSYMDRVKSTRDTLNEVGPGFCLMKWRNETLYLHMGDNHSCYHPRPQKIPLAEIKIDVSALHNTKWKKEQRKTMLEGGRPEECYYCWNIEDLQGENFSDRMFHSASGWLNAKKETEYIKSIPWDTNVNPMFLEVSFGNGCNFKCGYCCPQASSLWVDEIKKHGNYDISYNQYGIEFLDQMKVYSDEEPNPYIDAFWEWWPSLKQDLKVFRITGGEPLINSNTWKLLDKLRVEPVPDLELNLNSNMGVSNEKVKRLSETVDKLLTEKQIKSFMLYTSIDGWGQQAEYMRRGLDVDLWVKNLETFLNTNPNFKVSFMITYNILTVASFRPLLEKILELRKKFNINNNRINFDTPYLKEPPHWMMNLLPAEFGAYIDKDLDFIKENITNNFNGFDDHEYEKLKRVRDYFYEGGSRITTELVTQGRIDFYKFFSEYDSRSNLNLTETFPLYADFYNLCKDTYEANR